MNSSRPNNINMVFHNNNINSNSNNALTTAFPPRNPITNRKLANTGRMVLNPPNMNNHMRDQLNLQNINQKDSQLAQTLIQGKSLSLKNGGGGNGQIRQLLSKQQQQLQTPNTASSQYQMQPSFGYQNVPTPLSSAPAPHIFTHSQAEQLRKAILKEEDKDATKKSQSKQKMIPIHSIRNSVTIKTSISTKNNNATNYVDLSLKGGNYKQTPINNNINKQKEQKVANNNNKEEEMTLDQYFKISQKPLAEFTDESRKVLFGENNMNSRCEKIQEIQEDDQEKQEKDSLNVSQQKQQMLQQSGIIYNGDNDEDFFGFSKHEDLDFDSYILQLQQNEQVLNQDISKCDLEDIKSVPAYPQLIQHQIAYIKANSNRSSEQQIQSLKYFIFNGLEDSIWWRELPSSILFSVAQEVSHYPLLIFETFGKRLEKKLYQCEEIEKIQGVAMILLSAFVHYKSSSKSIFNSLLQLLKIKVVQEYVLQIYQEQKQSLGELFQDLLSSESGIFFLLTLKALAVSIPESLSRQIKSSITSFQESPQIIKLLKKLNKQQQQEQQQQEQQDQEQAQEQDQQSF